VGRFAFSAWSTENRDMSLAERIKRIFGAGSGDDAAAEREEYALPDPGEAGLRSGVPGQVADGARAVAHELDEFKAPRDPNP
jgi:hypothetical protein